MQVHDSLRWSHTHFICIPAVHIISFSMQVGLKRDSSFLLLYCDETSLRKYSPLIHSRFIMSSLKDHNHFVLMTETCKTKLVNKMRNIEESHDQTASSQVVFPKDLRM